MSLHSQLLLIEQVWASGQHALIPSLQDLFVRSHPDTALAWSDLAWLRIRSASQDAEPTSLKSVQDEALEMLLRAVATRAN